jgi:hypothetical protein
VQREPVQAMPLPVGLTSAAGIAASSASSSVVKRGQSEDVAQQAPQLWQSKAVVGA